MKLKTKAFEKLAKRKGYANGYIFLRALGAGTGAWNCFKYKKMQIGYEFVKDIYNILGESETLKIINFEEETINGFKSKYIELGGKLY